MPLAANPLAPQDVEYIRSSAARFVEYMLARNFESLSRMYAENACLMPPHSPEVHGRAAIKAWMDAFPKLTSFKPEVKEIFGYDDLAYARGAYSMTIGAGAGAAVEDTGKYVEIHRKQPDGTWAIAIDIFNSDAA